MTARQSFRVALVVAWQLCMATGLQAGFLNRVIQSKTCRFQFDDKLRPQCQHNRCTVGRAVVSPTLEYELPHIQPGLCSVQVPNDASAATIIVPTHASANERICNRGALEQAGHQFRKVYSDGSSVDVYKEGSHPEYSCGAENVGDYWCKADSLKVPSDPFDFQCAMTITADNVQDLYGNWKAIIPSGENLPAYSQDFVVKPVKSSCDVCFASHKCTVLSRSLMKTDADGEYYYQVTADLGARVCVVLSDLGMDDRDGYWSYVGPSPAQQSSAVQLSRSQEEPSGLWNITGISMLPGASVHGDYGQCLIIPCLTEGLSGAYVYHSYAMNATKTEIITVRINSSTGAAISEPATVYTASFSAVVFALLCSTCYLLYADRRSSIASRKLTENYCLMREDINGVQAEQRRHQTLTESLLSQGGVPTRCTGDDERSNPGDEGTPLLGIGAGGGEHH